MVELRLGQYCVLRETNIEKVAKITGYSYEDLREILDREKAKGEDRVKLPLVPRSLLELEN